MLVKLITWFILSYGLMNIMVFSSIFEGFRNKIKMIGDSGLPVVSPIFDFVSGFMSCPMCFSFHGGWFLSLFVFSPTFEFFSSPIWISWFFDGILSSGAVWAINSVIEWFEENRPNTNHL
jgi:hypothetical protein